MKKAARIKEIKHEIEWYEPKKRIADAMLELGNIGFKFSGHGAGFGEEDFSLCTNKTYVNFCDRGRKVVVSIYKNDEDMDTLYEGTIHGALKHLGTSG